MKDLTQERIASLLADIKTFEDRLRDIPDELISSNPLEVSHAWTSLAIAKAKLRSLQGGLNG